QRPEGIREFDRDRRPVPGPHRLDRDLAPLPGQPGRARQLVDPIAHFWKVPAGHRGAPGALTGRHRQDQVGVEPAAQVDHHQQQRDDQAEGEDELDGDGAPLVAEPPRPPAWVQTRHGHSPAPVRLATISLSLAFSALPREPSVVISAITTSARINAYSAVVAPRRFPAMRAARRLSEPARPAAHRAAPRTTPSSIRHPPFAPLPSP